MENNVKKILRELYPEKSGRNLSADSKIKAGVYLRQSTIDGQNYESVEEQLEFIRHRLNSSQIRSALFPQGQIVIADEFVYLDRGKTGRVGRDNYDAFKRGIQLGEFQVGLVYDLSRLTRELGSLLDAYNLAQAYNLELISVSESISSHTEGARIHFIAKGMANEMQSESTSRQTRRGLELRALSGKSTGHNPFGYTSVSENPNRPREPNEPANRIVVIDQDTAKVVKRIFDIYDSTNIGVDSIAKMLNEEGVISPWNRKWIGRTVYGILHQPKYIGVWIYGRTCTKRDSTRDRLVQVNRPQNEWVVQVHEHLRIISQELWDRVQEKLKGVELVRRKARNKSESIWGKNRGLSNHLFTGAMICGECGGNFMTISGKAGGYLGCRSANRIGTCKNKRMVQINWVEYTLLKELREWLSDSSTVDRICNQYNERITQRLSIIPQKIEEVERDLSKVDKSITNFVHFISEGNASDTVASALKKAEEKKSSLEAQLFNLRGREPKKLFVTPYFIQSSLCNLDEILVQDVSRANAYFKSLFVEPVRMVLQKSGKESFYEAQGKVNLTKLMRFTSPVNSVPNGIRTRVTAVKGQCPWPLDDGDIRSARQSRILAKVRGEILLSP